MKNKSIRHSLFTFTIILSFASFIYLNSLSSKTIQVENPINIEQVDVEDLSKKKDANLPDVTIVKVLIKFVKNLAPISQ